MFGDTIDDLERNKRQIARILSLDVDGGGYPQVGKRIALSPSFQTRYAGLRPVCFYSTYEAAVWAILSRRMQMRQAARIKERLREELGVLVAIHGEQMRAFPTPVRLMSISEAPSFSTAKLASLRVIAQAALNGDLDAGYLRSLPDTEALSRLREIPGIGPFSAELILLRGAGHPDYLTFLEPRFRRAVERAYGFDHLPTDDDLRRVSEAWRPIERGSPFCCARQVRARNPAPTMKNRQAAVGISC